MSMPAGWYDDGSGRQRWWDGTRWTDQFGPAQGASAPDAPVQAAPVTPRVPVLGFVGLGLAVVGTILACIPAVFFIGLIVLLAGFVLSLVGLFRKGEAKWPSIVGAVLSVLGGIIGAIVLVVSLAAGLVGALDPTEDPSATSSAQPSTDPGTGTADGRPSPADIAPAFLLEIQAAGIHDYDDDPEFVSCMGQYLYDSEISDEALQQLVDGQGTPESESAVVQSVTADGTVFCSTQ